MKYFESYGDFIKKGTYNKVTDIDDDWVLKMPLALNHRHSDKNYFTEKELKDFDEHIMIMKKYPNIFPKVKRLDKYRAAIEKVNTEEAMEEANWLYQNIYEDYGLDDRSFLTDILYNPEDYMELLELNRAGHEMLDMQLKWRDFIKLIQDSGIEKDLFYIGRYQIKTIDFHIGNVGIDRNGNLKLVDF